MASASSSSSDWWRTIADTISYVVPGTTTASASDAPANGMSEEEFRRRAISRMDATMRTKYGRGATYNFKLVIRGDTATGKSTLLRRLRGGTFQATYETTKEIKTAHVAWRAKSCPEDNVALEVWDVVDRAPKRNVSENLTLAKKANAATEGAHTFPLDATMVDVYRGAHACAVLVDPSKKWTFEYAMRTLEELPKHIPSALILNFRDYPDDKRVISVAEATEAVHDAFGSRPFTPVVIETSLLNCFGLSAVSTFLHVPFLCLKRATLDEALRANTTATVQAQEALEKIKESSYEAYTRKLGIHQATPEEQEAKEKADKASGAAPVEAPAESALSWSKLSNLTIGEIPLVVAGAALSSTASAVTTIARKTPAELSEDLANNLKNFASLGGSSAAANGTPAKDEASAAQLPPQFSHLGPGGVERAAFGGRDIADEDKAAVEAMIQKKGGDDGHWLDDDDDDDGEGGDDDDEEEDEQRNVQLKMDGWDDEDEDGTAKAEEDPNSPAHFIRQISADDPFFGKSDEKPKNGKPPRSPTRPSAVDLDPERLAAAFDSAPSKDEYETVNDPLGLTLARSATMSSSEMLSGSEKKEKKKKERKEKKEKKEKDKIAEKSASKSKSSRKVDWDESD